MDSKNRYVGMVNQQADFKKHDGKAGDLMFCKETQCLYYYNTTDKTWSKIESATDNIKTQFDGNLSMSLYELNQNIISQLPPYGAEKLEALKMNITNWDTKKNTSVKYYMLLNNEKHYYTVLHYNSAHGDFANLGDSVVYLLQEIGYAIVEEDQKNDHYEIWVKKDNETLCYLLFPYDQGVVTYG